MTTADPRRTDESRFLKALLASLAPKLSPGDVIGLSCLGEVAPPQTLRIADREFHVRRAESVLAVRQCMVEAEGAPGHLVIVTPLQTPQVGADVRARLYRQQLMPVGEWDAVRTAYGARQIDPRLLAERELAAHLVAVAPPDGMPGLPGGVLSADIAWQRLLERALGLPGTIGEPRDLLAWAASGRVAAFTAAPEPLRKAAIDWIARRLDGLGRLAATWLHAVVRGHALDLVPLGLACRVVFHASEEGAVPRKVGAARLEPYTQTPLEPREGLAWADAAEGLLAGLDPDAGDEGAGEPDPSRAARLEQRAEQVLAELRVAEHAWLSDVLPSGFDQRLERLAAELSAGIGGEARLLQAQHRILAAAREVGGHVRARREPARARRVEMALRLLRWMSDRGSAERAAGMGAGCASPATLAGQWVAEDAFVDRARLALRGEEANARLAEAYRSLAEQAGTVREGRNRAFARGIAGGAAAGDGLLGIERVLGEVVIPVARAGRVLLLVLDGLSWPVAHELLEDLERLGWSERVPAEAAAPGRVLATWPTVTECSRASLLAGRLERGDADGERAAFAAHAGLRSVSAVDAPPVLHHRASLASMGRLEEGLLADVASTRKIVGVVVNAVDDHLARDGQLHVTWGADTIRPLPVLLEHAARAERVVIIASDHGHVLDMGTRLQGARQGDGSGAGAGDRWRTLATGPAGDEEIVLSGERVLLGDGTVVVPWSERVRYGMPRWGYHGGATLQEAICPLVVLARMGQAVPGWQEAARTVPGWWRDGPLVAVATKAAPRRKAPARPAEDEPGFHESPRTFAITRVGGQVVEFTLPLTPTPEERSAIGMLVRYGRASERQLSRELGTRRIGGVMENLMRKLEAEGFTALDKEADGEDGRIFAFRPERLERPTL